MNCQTCVGWVFLRRVGSVGCWSSFLSRPLQAFSVMGGEIAQACPWNSLPIFCLHCQSPGEEPPAAVDVSSAPVRRPPCLDLPFGDGFLSLCGQGHSHNPFKNMFY